MEKIKDNNNNRFFSYKKVYLDLSYYLKLMLIKALFEQTTFLDQISSKRLFSLNTRPNEHCHGIQHIQISLETKFSS